MCSIPRLAVALAWVAVSGLPMGLCAQEVVVGAGGVYTCTDSQGRKLTADRPILECLDREQIVLNPSGTVRAKMGPSLSAQERADHEAKEKQEAIERKRIADEKRRDRALLARYPTRAAHDKERAAVLAHVNSVASEAGIRLDELEKQRRALDLEMEFYGRDLSKAPAQMRRQLEENTHNQGIQRRFISEQRAEVRRVNERFDGELRRLQSLWAAMGNPSR
jgi:hypothetical protein